MSTLSRMVRGYMSVSMCIALLGCSKGAPTETDPVATDTDTDLVDTDVVPPPPGATPLASLTADQVVATCATLGEIESFVLTCADYDLAYGNHAPAICEAALEDVAPACALTVDDLFACVDAIPPATCADDFSEAPCRALFSPACAEAGMAVEPILGGPYGLQDPMLLSGLTSSQVHAFCLETTDFAPVTVDCGSGEITIEPGTQEDCTQQLSVIPASCPATLGMARACIDEIEQGDCDAVFGTSPVCAQLVAPGCM